MVGIKLLRVLGNGKSDENENEVKKNKKVSCVVPHEYSHGSLTTSSIMPHR